MRWKWELNTDIIRQYRRIHNWENSPSTCTPQRTACQDKRLHKADVDEYGHTAMDATRALCASIEAGEGKRHETAWS